MKIFSVGLLFAIAVSFQINENQLQLPTDFSWDNLNNTNYLAPIRNQLFPIPCNSGWAMAASNLLNSRIKIMRAAKWPDIAISPQVLIDCDTLDYGCFGGDPWTAYKWISLNNITDESCNLYTAKQGRCTSAAKCMVCESDGCVGRVNAKIYSVGTIGSLDGENAMMEQIYNRGPISCAIGVTQQFKNYTKGIFVDTTDSRVIKHYVVVYGWGVENGVKFWRAQNSWGSSWGESGNFRIVRGSNNLSIETECSYAVPIDTWTNDLRNTTPPSPSLLIQSVSHMIPQFQSAPATFDWRFPTNYLTSTRSITSPKNCQSSWAISVAVTMSDKIKIASKGKSIVNISPQVLMNCGVGSCSKGHPTDAITFARKFGLTDESCQNYLGEVPSKASCTDAQNCAQCTGTLYNFTCTAAKNPKRWVVPDSGSLLSVQQMKTQISTYGPIVCGMHASASFKQYTGGIFSETTIYPILNHYVAVVGYGNEKGQEYWICRDFWGTAWGQSGFFRIAMHKNNLGIQKDCHWLGAPS